MVVVALLGGATWSLLDGQGLLSSVGAGLWSGALALVLATVVAVVVALGGAAALHLRGREG